MIVQVKISARHGHLGEATQQFIREKAEKLLRYFERLTSIDVTVDLKDERKVVEFLAKGDFAPGSFGHDLVAELKPADLMIEKVAYSAFYMSRMEFVLRRAGIDTLVFAGIVTNGGVASTVRDAHVRDFRCIVLADGCAAFSKSVHDATVASLASVVEISDCAEVMAALTR